MEHIKEFFDFFKKQPKVGDSVICIRSSHFGSIKQPIKDTFESGKEYRISEISNKCIKVSNDDIDQTELFSKTKDEYFPLFSDYFNL